MTNNWGKFNKQLEEKNYEVFYKRFFVVKYLRNPKKVTQFNFVL